MRLRPTPAGCQSVAWSVSNAGCLLRRSRRFAHRRAWKFALRRILECGFGVSVEGDVHPGAFDLDGIAPDGLCHRGTGRLSGPDIELSLVKGAFDLVPVQEAFAQPSMT